MSQSGKVPAKLVSPPSSRRGVVPAVEHRRRHHVFERAERPVQVGVHERRMKDIERAEPEHHARRNPGHQQHDVDPDGPEQQVHRVKARRGNPVHILGRMMDGVVSPEPAAMEHAVQPVHHEIGSDQEQDRLQPQRQRRQRAMAVVVEGDQVVGIANPEQQAGAEHQQPDPEDTRRTAAPGTSSRGRSRVRACATRACRDCRPRNAPAPRIPARARA